MDQFFIQLEIDVTIAAIGLLALTHSARFQNTRVILIWNLDVKREALAVGIEFTPPRQTLINRRCRAAGNDKSDQHR